MAFLCIHSFSLLELVQNVVIKGILQKYNMKAHQVSIICCGSSYELTGVPSISDYDVQFCLQLPKTKINGIKQPDCHVEESAHPGWRKIKGGDSKLLENGYLSTYKVGLLLHGCWQLGRPYQLVI